MAGFEPPLALLAELDEKRRAWHVAPSEGVAGDLLSAAALLGLHDDADVTEAAKLLRSADQLPLVTELLVRKTLGEPAPGPATTAVPIELTRPEDAALQIRARATHARQRTRGDPADSLAWVDLAWAQTVLQQPAAAMRSMATALAINPADRFVLRSGSRMLLHVGDPEAALSILRRFGDRQDPWIVAAEVATERAAGGHPRLNRAVRELVADTGLRPKSRSELAVALADILADDGADRHARRMLRVGLVDPTENALAQGVVLSHRIQGLEHLLIDRDVLADHEAKTLISTANCEWQEALKQSELWLADQPFSSRPAAHGSYVASAITEDFRLAELFARFGLRANPNNALLWNNLAFALAMQGRLPEASDALREADRDQSRPFALATRGLVAIKSGDIDEGRFTYGEAVAQFLSDGAVTAAAEAAINETHALVEARALYAVELARARDLALRASGQPVKVMMQRLEKAHLSATGSGSVSKGR